MILLARPEEVLKLEAKGYRSQGPSKTYPRFMVMALVPDDPPAFADREMEMIAGAVAALGDPE